MRVIGDKTLATHKIKTKNHILSYVNPNTEYYVISNKITTDWIIAVIGVNVIINSSDVCSIIEL